MDFSGRTVVARENGVTSDLMINVPRSIVGQCIHKRGGCTEAALEQNNCENCDRMLRRRLRSSLARRSRSLSSSSDLVCFERSWIFSSSSDLVSFERSWI
ncbi:hypothetical protein Dimus_027353 [Dionaea muscipula]